LEKNINFFFQLLKVFLYWWLVNVVLFQYSILFSSNVVCHGFFIKMLRVIAIRVTSQNCVHFVLLVIEMLFMAFYDWCLFVALGDALLSPGVKPTWGFHKVKLRKVETWRHAPGPSFAHNLGCKCPNDQCKAIFDIYVSRPFQWHQEHPNARCFGPCCRALNIRESRRTPNPQLFQVLGFTPTLGQSGVATLRLNKTNPCYGSVQNIEYSYWVCCRCKWG
jgi:hypothetical protein